MTFLPILTLAVGLLLGLPASSGAAERPDRPTSDAADDDATTAGRTVMILGVSWQPAFCETRSKAPECAEGKLLDEQARRFSLHGLWRARKTYCGVSDDLKAQDKARKWLELPELALDEDLKVELANAMPGTASGLDRHEWIKHGTCSGDVASAYYGRSLKLLAALNASAVGKLFESHVGASLDEAAVKAAFDESFGAGAGDKIRMRCAKDGSRRVIIGLTIGLGDPGQAGGADLGALIQAARKTKFGCPEGIVDEAGLQ